MSSKPGFTPGPWFADGEHICGNGTEINVDGYTIAIIQHAFSMGRFARKIRKDESICNGRLIEAAPDLYEALKEVLDSVKPYNKGCSGEFLTPPSLIAMEKARAALLKAGGE